MRFFRSKLVRMGAIALGLCTVAPLGANAQSVPTATITDSFSYYLPPSPSAVPYANLAGNTLSVAFSSANLASVAKIEISQLPNAPTTCIEGDGFAHPAAPCTFQRVFGNPSNEVHQINFLVPSKGNFTPRKFTKVEFKNSTGRLIASGGFFYAHSSPALLTQNGTGVGALAGTAMYVNGSTIKYFPLAVRNDRGWEPATLPSVDRATSVYLLLTGTGRGAEEPGVGTGRMCPGSNVPASGELLYLPSGLGLVSPIIYYGNPGYKALVGTDQVNIDATLALRKLSQSAAGFLVPVQLRYNSCYSGSVHSNHSYVYLKIGAPNSVSWTRMKTKKPVAPKKSKPKKKKKGKKSKKR